MSSTKATMTSSKTVIVFLWCAVLIAAAHATDLRELLDVYNTGRLALLLGPAAALNNNNSSAGQQLMSKTCAKDMYEYSDALIAGKIWAAKMSDASGRYSTGFLWGNNFWLGSADLCANLGHKDTPLPPFEVAFSVARLSLQLTNVDLTPVPRTLYVGMCLPWNCDPEDVHSILELSLSSNQSSAQKNERSLQVVAIRSPDHDTYKYWLDPTFVVLTVVSSIVFVLMCAGSAYDLYLSRQVHASRRKTLKMHSSCSAGDASHGVDSMEVGGCHLCCSDVKPLPRLAAGAIALDVISVPHTKLPNGEKECNGNSVVVGAYSNPDAILEEKPAGDVGTEALSWPLAVLLCFSVPQNARTIFDRSVGGDTLATIHGLRFFSMVWVILGHSCIVVFKYADNTDFRGVVEKEFMFQTISNAAFSVDTFFFISGLLFSFLYFRTTAKVDLNVITRSTGVKSKMLQFVGLLAYRFGRLTAPYLYVLGVVQVSMRWFYHKSVFEPPTLDHENCPKYWWRNALYINTLFPVKDMCMLWSWYLADDTQFYVLGAIIMIIAISHFRVAAGMFATFMVSSWFTTAYIAYINNHQPSLDDPLALFDKIYDKPWTRLGPYLVGMATGWLLYTTDCRLKFNKGGVALGWTLCGATLLSLLYGLYDAQLDAFTSAAYSSLSHSAWAMGTAWIVVACSTGHGGYVSKILSAPLLYPLSRVTYCAYLVHPLVIRAMVMYADSPMHLAKITVTLLFMGHMVVSYIIAFVISLAFEAPVVALLRIVSPKKDRSGSPR